MTASLHFGPRLVSDPTGRLRAAVLVKPGPAIERATPLIGEPGAIYERALEQHAVLVKTLQYYGVQTIVLEPSTDDPFESAAGNAAVAFEDGALVMRPSAMSRRNEAQRMEAEFGRIDVPLAGHIAPPGLLDGNDVLLVGETAYVGVGRRGNAIGRNGFAQVAQAHGYRTVEVKLADGVPALRAVASAVAGDTVVLAADLASSGAFSGLTTIALDRGEDLAAGALTLGERRVLLDLRYRAAPRVLRRARIAVESIDLYEFEKVGITPAMLVLALRRD
jgi:dimethylargininase